MFMLSRMSFENYYVVNTGRGNRRSQTLHLMKSWSSSTPSGLIAGAKSTLCGKVATRSVNVFQPSEVTCRECKRRWQINLAQQEAKQASRTA